MTMERLLRGIAGGFVLGSLALGWLVHPGFFLLTAFVGVNLFQSALTGWCPMMWFLGKLGVPASCPQPTAVAAGRTL
ncbi:MAG: DUF2892 domain-containing protein [Thermoanaerobaculia bacterium]